MRPGAGGALIVALGLVLAPAGPACAQNFGGGPLDERYFRIEHEAVRPASGPSTIRGWIRNLHDLAARNVELLVEALDATGRPVASTRGWVTGDVPAEGSRVFTIRAPAAAASYRVTVVNWEWLCRDGPM